ncbi:MAG TPA: autotransporter outer membrane beta-barrel domain-containing protein [Allosphingosinicella sp.]|jgi:outer membrane autotransporter protein
MRGGWIWNRGTSLGATAAAIAAWSAPATAKDPPPPEPASCSPIVDGEAFCPAEGNPYPEGIVFIGEGEDYRVVLEDGVAVDAKGPLGLYADNKEDGSIRIRGAGASISANERAVTVSTDRGDIDLALGSVAMTADFRSAVGAYSNEGDVSVDLGSLTTSGEWAFGVDAYSVTGNVSVSIDSIETTGNVADGITAVAEQGSVSVEAGTISTHGDAAWGVNAFSGGNMTVTTGDLSIDGDVAAGVNTVSLGTTTVTTGDVTVTGEGSQAIAALGWDAVTVTAENINVSGENSGGVGAASVIGDARITVGNVTTTGGGGIGARSEGGDAVIHAGIVSVSGDYAIGVGAGSEGGAVLVDVASVTTNGVFAVAVGGESFGDVTIRSGAISTQGELAMGVRAFGGTVSVDVTGALTTTGDSAFGVLSGSRFGDAVVRTAGPVSTSGDFAVGLWVVGRNGIAIVRNEGGLATSGDRATGILATGEDGAVSVVSTSVSTTGDLAHGIEAETKFLEVVPFEGPGIPPAGAPRRDIDIVSGSVAVTGEGSRGISAIGLGNISIAAGTTRAARGEAIFVDANKLAEVTVTGTARSDSGDAVSITGCDIVFTLASGGSVFGASDGLLVNAVGFRPIVPPGEIIFFADPAPAGTAKIFNHGTLSAGSGYAIRVDSGTASIRNFGTLVGAVRFAGGDDRLYNNGLFVADGNSRFGDGDDLFVNRGTLRLAHSGSGPTRLRFDGLERFENRGLIDLGGGAVGDRLILSGDFDGSGGSMLRLDVAADATGTAADTLVVRGAASGTTRIALNLVGGPGVANADGALLVNAGSAPASAFELAGPHRSGFVDYSLRQRGGDTLLLALPNELALEPLLLAEAGSDLWHQSAGAWSQSATLRRDTIGGGSRRVSGWLQGYAGTEERGKRRTVDLAGTAQDVDLRQDLDRQGFQGGFDFAAGTGGAVGITAGWEHFHLDFRSGTRAELQGYNVGAYALYQHPGGVFAQAVAKADFFDGNIQNGSLFGGGDLKGKSYGAEGELGYRYAGSGVRIDASGALAWVRSELDDLAASNASFDYRASDGVRGRVGLRVSGTAPGLAPYADARLFHEFREGERARFHSGGYAFAPVGRAYRTSARGEAGVAGTLRSLGGFVSVWAELGDSEGYGLRLGLRF